MAEVVLFHHAQGLTPGVVDFADELRRAGHAVHTPDLFEGRTFGSIEDGMGYAQEIGFPDEVIGRGARAVEGLPAELVYAGFSLGVLPAQKLAQTRPGARGALLFTPACRCRRSALPGPKACRCRCMGWTTRSSSERETSTPPANSSRRRKTESCLSTTAASTISPTVRCRHTTRTLLQS
jgi:dienelactone hydrolase